MGKTLNKTQPNEHSVDEFIKSIEHDGKRKDSYALLRLMEKVTGHNAKMWGDSLIGFGQYHYKYASGREGDWFLVGFSPRKQNISLYVMAGIARFPELLESLGKHKTGKGCLYINKLEDIDIKVLEQLIKKSAQFTEENQSAC